MKENQKALDVEYKLAFIRISVVLLGILLTGFGYAGAMWRFVAVVLGISTAYSISIFVFLYVYRKKIYLISMCFVAVDILLLTAGLSFIGIDSNFTPMCFILIISTALRYSVLNTMMVTSVLVAGMIGSEYIYHMLTNRNDTLLHVILLHLHWYIYIVFFSVVAGFLSDEARREKFQKEQKQKELLASKHLIHKFNIFTREVNKVNQLLLTREAAIEDLMGTILTELMVLLNGVYAQMIIFDSTDNIEYAVRQPKPFMHRAVNVIKNSENKGCLFILFRITP